MIHPSPSESDVVHWSSGDCRPVMAVSLSVEVLTQRREAKVFRDQDDLDFFTGAVWQECVFGPLLAMRHDGNPLRITALYVDSASPVGSVQASLIEFFGFAEAEIAWLLE